MGIEDLSEVELRQKVLAANLHKAPSVGAVVNRILAINPALGVPEVLAIIRRSSARQGSAAGDFASAEVVDVPRALALARSTLTAPGAR